LELAYQEGKPALDFILGHELAHIKRNHVFKNQITFIAQLLPGIGRAYSRACEYTCDKMATYHVPNGALAGLFIFASGKNLYNKINLPEYIIQARSDEGFWTWHFEQLSTHPHLYKRIIEVNNFINLIKDK
jgi:Zn-dependent protease with chaperone function